MDEDIIFALIGLAAIGIFFAPLVLSLVALSRTKDFKRRIAALEARLSAQAFAVAETAIEPAAAEHVVEAAAPLPEPSSTPAAEPVMVAPRRAHALEERLTSRWLVWLGAVALVFAGLFLVKYSIDSGLLTPEMRVILGLLLGIGLIAAGEAIRRRQPVSPVQNYVPGALTSAGLFICFASVYAGHALLGIISPGVAFAGLAVIALAAFALGALHTPIVAILGLLAGYVTPILVGAGTPSAALFFGYLALIGAAAYAVVLFRAWGWLAYGVLAGSLVWVAVWIFGPLIEADLLVLALFLAALTAASTWLALAFTPPEVPPLWRDPKREGQGPEINAWFAATGSVLLFVWAVAQTGSSFFGLALAAAGTFGLALAGRRWQRFDGLAVHAGALLALALISWNPAEAIASVSRDEQVGNIVAAGALMAPAAQPFVFAHLAGAAFIAVLGFVLLRGALRPYIFAGASLASAAAILAAAYARIHPITTDTLWALVSAGAAALAVAAAGALNNRREDRPYRLSLGFYAAAAAAGVAFTFALVFRQAWLTVALSLELPALAWLERRLDLRELRHLALAVAAAVLIRLALNPYVLDYDANETLGAQWIVYGYGVPALAFYVAARLFRAPIADRAVIVLETGALAFALLLASLEIRIFAEGRIAAPNLTLYELSLHTLVWLAVAWWRARAYAADRHTLDAWWFAIVGGLALAAVVVGQLVVLNPVLTGESVGGRPILDTLLVAYLAPAVLISLIAKETRLVPTIGQRVSIVLFAMALLLAMTWLTLETKRFFQGPRLTAFSQSDAEYYAYSVIWLLSSFVLLGLGIWRRSPWLRHGALAILILTVLKVFLSDMAALGGLYRVASFLGLGLCLVGIGYLYQRFVFVPRPAPPVTG